VHPLFASPVEAQKEDAQMAFSGFTYATHGKLVEELHVTKRTIRQWEALRGFSKLLLGSGRVSLNKTPEVATWLENSKETQQ
jgi:hypothetical protein